VALPIARTVSSALCAARDSLVSVLLPAPCRICDGVLDTASRVPICAACLAKLTPITRPLCTCCGKPLISPQVETAIEVLCRLCRAETYAFRTARSFGAYDSPMVRAILLLKHEGVVPLGAWMAARLAELAAREPARFLADAVVPVPLHRARRRERGYNQAELIARPLARKLGLPCRTHLLARVKPRPEALQLTRRQRWETVRGAFAVPSHAKVDKLRILLVDDVLTTGATLDACSRALLRAGAVEVSALTVARAVWNWAPVQTMEPDLASK